MELADILEERSILGAAKVSSKRQLLQLMAEKAAEVTNGSATEIFEILQQREQIGSTGLGNGIAIPHGKLEGLAGVKAVFARLADPIEFESVDDRNVDLVMMLLAPAGAGADHLKALARVARLLRTESIVSDLRATDDDKEIYKILMQPMAAHFAA